jgi:hypothetical protein
MFSFFEPWYPAFTQVNLIQKMKQSYLDLSPDNHENFDKRMIAYQIHLTLGNIAYCVFSNRKEGIFDHINRLTEVLSEQNPAGNV